jgi:hypothetical protein
MKLRFFAKKLCMTRGRKIGVVLIVAFVGIQFIRPEKNTGLEQADKSISAIVQLPETTHELLKKSCYDCHSNTTQDQWYMSVQPIGWWIAHHVEEGKEELNFSEFATYPLKKQQHKFEEIAEVVGEDEMPLSSYTFMHAKAKLTTQQREEIINWANEHK